MYYSLIMFCIWNHSSNAVKFTHEGKVGINLHVLDKQLPGCRIEGGQLHSKAHSAPAAAAEHFSASPRKFDNDTLGCSNHEDACQTGIPSNDNFGEHHEGDEVVWLRCDVYDTGIGIPGISCYLLVIHDETFFVVSRTCFLYFT